jgi:hypothetical protein
MSKRGAVSASSAAGTTTPHATIPAITVRGSDRPGMASRRAAATITMPAIAWPIEKPQVRPKPSTAMSERKKWSAGTATTIAAANGTSAKARTSGGRNGRTGVRSRAIFSRSSGGALISVAPASAACRETRASWLR